VATLSYTILLVNKFTIGVNKEHIHHYSKFFEKIVQYSITLAPKAQMLRNHIHVFVKGNALVTRSQQGVLWIGRSHRDKQNKQTNLP
jgi:hypothetical protein